MATVTANTTVYTLFKMTKDMADSLKPGEEFRVRDLFRGFEWNRISVGDRIRLGERFLDYVRSGSCKTIKELGKNAQNQQCYEKL